MEEERVSIADDVTEDRLAEHLREARPFIGGGRVIPFEATVFIKSNLTWRGPTRGVTTRPEFIAAIVAAIKERTDRIIAGKSDGGYIVFMPKELLPDIIWMNPLSDSACAYSISAENQR